MNLQVLQTQPPSTTAHLIQPTDTSCRTIIPFCPFLKQLLDLEGIRKEHEDESHFRWFASRS